MPDLTQCCCSGGSTTVVQGESAGFSIETNPTLIPGEPMVWFDPTVGRIFTYDGVNTPTSQIDIDEGEVVDAFGNPVGIDI